MGERTAIAGYYLSVRLAGTAIVCILAAFGAAFLVARAVNHETPARAATPPAHTTRVAATVTHAGASHHTNAALQSQFAPIKGSDLKPKPKPKPKQHKPRPSASVTPVTPTNTTAVTPTTPVYTTPSSSPPPPTTTTPAPTHSTGGSTHHKKSGGGSGGSGTTTIGG